MEFFFRFRPGAAKTKQLSTGNGDLQRFISMAFNFAIFTAQGNIYKQQSADLRFILRGDYDLRVFICRAKDALRLTAVLRIGIKLLLHYYLR